MNVMGDAYGAGIVYHLTKAELQLQDRRDRGEMGSVDQQVLMTKDVSQDPKNDTAEGVGSNSEKEQHERDPSPTDKVDEVLEVQEVNQDPKNDSDDGGV